MILIYIIGRCYLSERVARVSAYFYIFSHSTVYQVSMYSENTYVLFQLLGFYIISHDEKVFKIKNHRVILASFFFGLAAMTRSTGILLSVYVAYINLPKILKTQDCLKIFKYIMTSWICALMILVPYFVI